MVCFVTGWRFYDCQKGGGCTMCAPTGASDFIYRV
jgi:hypothetical protein